MNRSEFLPTQIQDRISYEERLENARRMAKAEKDDQITAEMDKFYAGESTDQSINYDRQELNDYMSAD